MRTPSTRLGTVLLALSLAAGCATAERTEGPPGETRPAGDRVPEDAEMLPMEIVYQSPHSGVEDSRRVVVRADSTWGALWSEIQRGRRAAATPPRVDFDRWVVVVATAGTSPTGGHTIDIEGVLANEDGVWVGVVKTVPGESCVTTQAETAPAVAVKAPKRDGPVKFIDRTVTRDC